MKQPTSNPTQSPYNKEVRAAYQQILKEAKTLLSTIEREELRFSLVREDKPKGQAQVLHEFCNPLLYLRLESYADNTFGIRYGFEPGKDYAHITVAFTRFLYKVTMKDATSHNIEYSIKTDWYIHNPDEMYQYLEEQQKHHQFNLIKYKPASMRKTNEGCSIIG